MATIILKALEAVVVTTLSSLTKSQIFDKEDLREQVSRCRIARNPTKARTNSTCAMAAD